MWHLRPFLPACLWLSLAGCAIHHVTPYRPDVSNAPQTADAASASTDCFEKSTAAESAICASPILGAANDGMIQSLHRDFRGADLFARDALLASQRVWLLGLAAQCHLPDPPATSGADNLACLDAALRDRKTALQAWMLPPMRGSGRSAIAQYVNFHSPAGARTPPAFSFCTNVATRANAAILLGGEANPAAMGGEEIAGTHGPDRSSADTRHRVSVDLYDANVFGLFQRRSRSVSLDGGPPVITPVSLTQLLQAQATENEGGRFSAYASQTGDYGAVDVFRLDGRLLVLASDPWGSTAPAAPGEAAHAGIWDISGTVPVPVCAFDTYTRPAEPGIFDTLPNYAPWRDLLNEIRNSATLPLGIATRREQARLVADTVFIMLHQPLLALQQATDGGWIVWLRLRHDAVLDALFRWSSQDPANKRMFDRVFALLHPAAQDLAHAYQTTQGLTAAEATQATGLTIMEMLYEATGNIAPDLGSDLRGPAGVAGSKPRYPILATP